MSTDWAEAFIALLSKSQNLASVSEFRPIAVTSTIGKIFFSVTSERLQSFMTSNDYISRTVQKGFLTGVAGCIEHTFTLMEALKEANAHTRQIVITWIDLANAYGSVRHNLIQFALNWFHVPLPIQELIFNYYEKLCAMIKTKEWSSGFFLFDIGLFQGCVLSTILFDCVFQLLLDFLKPTKMLGYHFKTIEDTTALTKAYADDLTLISHNVSDNQVLCDLTHTWLCWSITMKAKPSKCVSMAMKMFFRNIKNEKFTPIENSTYSLFDPQLRISGQPIRFILNREDPDSFKGQHFKFLGRWIHAFLKEHLIKEKIKKEILNEIQVVDNCLLNGFMKLWLYQFYVLYHFSWPLLIHDLDKSFAVDIQRLINPYLKKWAGIGRTVDNGVLFRSNKNYGLGLTCFSDHYEKMQLVKCELLKNSVDESVKKIYKAREKINSNFTRAWKATNVAKTASAEVELDLKFPTQATQQGLGFGNFHPQPSISEKRKLISAKASSFREHARIIHSSSLSRQGIWLHWSESALPFDLSWKNLIWGNVSASLIKFVLHASVNWLTTPDLLKLWGFSKESTCPLCNEEKCTIHHILCHCNFSLQNKRYSWRHDSVLSSIASFLSSHIEETNKSTPRENLHRIPFIKANEKKKMPGMKSQQDSLLDKANDWKLLVDLPGNNYVFPIDIYCTEERPDIVIWSPSKKMTIIIELTCPAEEGIENAKLRKETKYLPLISEIRRQNKFTVNFMTVEVGVRGFIATSLKKCFAMLGLPKQKSCRACKEASYIAASCSHTIFLAASSKFWNDNKELLVIPEN